MLIWALLACAVVDTRRWTVPTYDLGAGGDDGFTLLVDLVRWEEDYYVDSRGMEHSFGPRPASRQATVLWCTVVRDDTGSRTTCEPVLDGDEAQRATSGPKTFARRLSADPADSICTAMRGKRAGMQDAGIAVEKLPPMPEGCDDE